MLPQHTAALDVAHQQVDPAPRGGWKKKNGHRHNQQEGPFSTPRLPGDSHLFAIEHRVFWWWEKKKYKFRPSFLGADGGVDDPKRFVPFVLEASEWLGRKPQHFWNI